MLSLVFLAMFLSQAAGMCSDSEMATISQCTKPLFDLWSRYNRETPDVTMLSFPLFKYTRTQLLFLCDSYRHSIEDCLSPNIRKSCARNARVSFATSLFDYACSSNSWMFFKHQECLAGAVEHASSRCSNLIRIDEMKGAEKRKCRNIGQYFQCVAGNIEAECRDKEAMRVMRESIASYGCKIEPAICTSRDEDTASICLGPMLERWHQLPAIHSPLVTRVFPLFFYTPRELGAVCALYEDVRQQCLSDDLRSSCRWNVLVEFVDSNLHLACNLSDADRVVFSRSFACISTLVQRGNAAKCADLLRGRATPGSYKHKCDRIPAFYACAKHLVEKECSSEALGILEEAIDQFGCETDILTLPATENKTGARVEEAS